MFERFSGPARQVVMLARENAQRRRHGSIGTEHLLLGLLQLPDGTAGDVLTELGVTRADIDATISERRAGEGSGPTDRQALASIGIDLDEVRRQAEQAFGPGALERTRTRRRHRHLTFEPAAKRVLEASLREALRLRHNYIGTEHLLLGLLASPGGSAYRLLTDRGISLGAARAAVAQRTGG